MPIDALKCILLFILLLASGCSSPVRRWQVTEVNAANPFFSSTRFYLPPETQMCSVDAEILFSAHGDRFYLNTHSLPFIASDTKGGYSMVTLQIGEEEFVVIADRLEGGQRLLLNPETTALVIAALSSHHDVKVTIGPYRAVLQAYGFSGV